MPVTKNANKMDLKAYEVTFKGVTLGWTKDVDPSGLKTTMVEKKIGELGNVTLDDVTNGLEGTITITLHQVGIDELRAVIPGAPTTGAIPLTPPSQFASMYATAGVLCLHPRGNPDAVEDINLVKAAIVNYKLPKSSDGKTYRELQIEFKPYPDQALATASTPTLVYGYVGPIPV